MVNKFSNLYLSIEYVCAVEAVTVVGKYRLVCVQETNSRVRSVRCSSLKLFETPSKLLPLL